MFLSKYTLTADGTTNVFPVNFSLGFLSRDDVTVRVNEEVDGSDDPIYRTLTWINDGSVSIGATPDNLDKVHFTRTVSSDVLAHDFSDGASITEENLDQSHLQLLMLYEQVIDGRFGESGFQNDLNLGGNKMINIGDGTEDTDAVTFGQLQAILVSAGAGDMHSFNNLSDLTNKATARANLGLGSLATQNSVTVSTGDVTGLTAALAAKADATAISNINNTSDANKPVSIAVQALFDAITDMGEAEAQAGTGTVFKLVSAQRLAQAIATQVPAASETTAGRVELATETEALAGVSTAHAVTPAGMKAAIDAAIAAHYAAEHEDLGP